MDLLWLSLLWSCHHSRNQFLRPLFICQGCFGTLSNRNRAQRNENIWLQWRHNERDGVSNHRRLDCLLNRLFRCWSKKTPKLRVTGLCERNSPVADESPAQRASSAENVSISWRNHVHVFGGIDYICWPLATLRPITRCKKNAVYFSWEGCGIGYVTSTHSGIWVLVDFEFC